LGTGKAHVISGRQVASDADRIVPRLPLLPRLPRPLLPAAACTIRCHLRRLLCVGKVIVNN